MMTKLKAFLVLLALVLLPAMASAQPNGYFFPPHWMYDPALGALVAPNRILLPDGTAAAPALAWSGQSNTGLYRTASDLRVSTGGFDSLRILGNGLAAPATGYYSWGSSGVTGQDLFLYRGAANTLYQKNGANPQAFWLANTDDGAGNYERLTIFGTAATAFKLMPTAGGTGALRPVAIGDGGTKPTCDASNRGGLWYDAGAAGALDTLEVCRKDAANNYAWVSLF
jgi:hypothetical protein